MDSSKLNKMGRTRRIVNVISTWRLLLIFLVPLSVTASTTGKIAGKVVEAETSEPLPGANILLENLYIGAASDMNGNYFILNVPPGTYSIVVTMIGYKTVRMENVQVSVNLTTRLDFNMEIAAIEGEEVIVTAEKPMVQMDLTSSQTRIGSEDIEQLPVEDFQDIVNLQAGVVEGHFRGGRKGEVMYMIDGIPMNDVFTGEFGLGLENNVIQELELISGTFNAEYGQAMSGIVNIVTKDPSKNFSGHLSSYLGDYFSNDNDIFNNLDNLNMTDVYNLQWNIDGPLPVLSDKLFFFVSGRNYNNEGYIYGKEVFDPSDAINFEDIDSTNWHIYVKGDSMSIADGKEAASKVNDFTPMAYSKRTSLQGKLTFKISSKTKISYNLIWQDRKYRQYDHTFKFNPDGDYRYFEQGLNQNLIFTNQISLNTFYSIKGSNAVSKYQRYVYENSLDDRYVDPVLLNDHLNAFRTGGTQMWHTYRTSETNLLKAELTSQVNPVHLVKLGLEGKLHSIKFHEFEIIQDENSAEFTPEIPGRDAFNNNLYIHKPYEFSGYIQDKIELTDLIVNIGVRFDYFEPDGIVPTDLTDIRNEVWEEVDSLGTIAALMDPVDPTLPWRYKYRAAKAKSKISPRFGLAYPISDRGAIHVSYGHFFQLPTFNMLYHNPDFDRTFGNLRTLIGNADLEPEQTVTYEMGIQQQIGYDYSIDITGFYKDIRNLTDTGIEFSEVWQERYARYINRDYGQIKGITITLDKRTGGNFSGSIDYTYQVAKGNASDPEAAFQDAQADREPEKVMVFLNWDRTHSLNIVLTSGTTQNVLISLIGNFYSGLPYTPDDQFNKRTAPENSERKPFNYNFDLHLKKTFQIGDLKPSIFLKVYNLFDRRNEKEVFATTGRANYNLGSTNTVNGINTIEEYLVRPDFYSEPRRVQMGFSVNF